MQLPSSRHERWKYERQSITAGTAMLAAVFTPKSTSFRRRSRHTMPSKKTVCNESGCHRSPHGRALVGLGRSAVDFFRLERLLGMGVSGDQDQLAHAAAACSISLAVENEVDGFCGLRPHEGVVEIRP